MTDPEEEAISVALVHDEGAGSLFFADICRMLERVADRLDVRLETETSTTTARVYRLPFGVKLPRELDREVGIHRAQLVPDRSVSGRVVTAKVTVTIEPKRDRGTSAHVIKTYSYPTNRVTLHETGEVLAMDVVLAGLAV